MKRGIWGYSAAVCLLLCGCAQDTACAAEPAETPAVCTEDAERLRREEAAAQYAAAWAAQYAMLPPEIRVLLAHDHLLRVCRYRETGTAVSSAYGALLCGEAVCTGYAEGFRLLCTAAGTPCVTVHGAFSGGAGETLHAWNLVFLGGAWYHIDCTHDDIGEVPQHMRFLCSDAEMSSQYVWDRQAYPAAEGGELSFGSIVGNMRDLKFAIRNAKFAIIGCRLHGRILNGLRPNPNSIKTRSFKRVWGAAPFRIIA